MNFDLKGYTISRTKRASRYIEKIDIEMADKIRFDVDILISSRYIDIDNSKHLYSGSGYSRIV